jgi:urea transport system ATP-binding protein
MLQIQQLNQYYGGSHILRDVSFEVPSGKLTTLLGRNGVGKTTLLKCLMGVVPTASGAIDWEGRAIQKLPAYERVSQGLAYVPQGREIFPRLTVEENLLIGAAAKRAPSKVPDSIYELFPVLKEMKGRRGGDLSGGQQQQLAIGRALMSQPRLLIQEIGRTLRRLVDEFGMSVLLVEQYYDFARRIADRYVVMSRGEVIAQGDGANMEADGVRDLVAV